MRHSYEARGAHSKIFTMRDREILIRGLSGSGTERACMEKIVTEAMRYPGMQGLICRKIAKDLPLSVTPILEREVMRELLGSGFVKFYNATPRTLAQYHFPSNGSAIFLGGLDDSKRILNSIRDMVYVMNATDLDLDDWENVGTTLLGNAMGYTQLLGSCLAQHPQHWLKLRCAAGRTTYLEATHQDNALLFNRVNGEFKITEHGRAVLARLSDVTGVRRNRNVQGIWAAAEGLIYPAPLMIKNYIPPNDWGRIWVFDFGYTAPLSWVNWIREPDGRDVAYQEVYRTHRHIEDHLEVILNATTRAGQPRPEAIICDHDAKDRDKIEKILSKEWGIPVKTIAATKGVKQGITVTQKRFKMLDIAIMYDTMIEDRDPVLVELEKPTRGVDELAYYIWADEGQDAPNKRDDHFCDNVRYMSMYESMARSRQVEMRR
jgi:phage terminase large subunit